MQFGVLAVDMRIDGDEHVAGEEALPGGVGDDADGHAVVGVSADVAVLNEQLLALQEGLQALEQRVELVGGEGAVVIARPDLLLGGGLADDVLVGGGPGGVLAGVDDEGPSVDEMTLAAEDGLLDQGGPKARPRFLSPPRLTRESLLAESQVGKNSRRCGCEKGFSYEPDLLTG